MTIEYKRAELEAAGIKVRANASDERIEQLYEEHQASIAEHGPIATESREPVEGAPAKPFSAPSGNHASKRQDDFNAFLAAHGSIAMGDKTPVVVEWARENLSPEEFAARYEGRIR